MLDLFCYLGCVILCYELPVRVLFYFYESNFICADYFHDNCVTVVMKLKMDFVIMCEK